MKSMNTRSTNSKSYARSIAPSQLKKMVSVEYFPTKVLPCTARIDILIAGMRIAANERYFLVESDKFRSYAYVVTWNEERIRYVCSCGNPRCTAHIEPALEYARLHGVALRNPVQVVRVVESTITDSTTEDAYEMLLGMRSSVEGLAARIRMTQVA